jgi:hypothetical protein
MSDRILQKFAIRSGAAAESAETDLIADGDDVESFPCFGWLRGMRERSTCLELRQKSGIVLAIPYAYITRMEFQPSGMITLVVGTESVRIKGRNLNGEIRPQVRLFQGICRQRVPWVVEADRPVDLNAGQTATVIEQIEW